MAYILEHTKFGFCWWDLAALVVLVAVVVIFVMKYVNMKTKQRDLEDQVSKIYSEGVETEVSAAQN
jgi:hypothetical protein